MVSTPAEIIEELAQELHYPKDLIMKESLKVFLEGQLRRVKSDILHITGKYHVTSAEDMEARYREGTMEEEDTWRDLERLDHLEYKRDYLTSLLKKLQ